MNFDLTHSHQRALDDMLQAEHSLRANNEIVIRDMQQILLELAIRLDGQRIEALRRADPGVPSSWGSKEWRSFFNEASLPGKGWGSVVSASQPVLRAQRELAQQIEGLKAQLALATNKLEQERAKPAVVATVATVPVEAPKSAAIPEVRAFPFDITPPASIMTGGVEGILRSLPQKPPASFADRLNGGGRIGGDLAHAFQRYFVMLYLIGQRGLASVPEIMDVMSPVVKAGSGSGSLKRILEDLTSAGFVVTELSENPQSSLVMARLSPDGEKLHQAVFGKRPIENEWSRLIRRHAGGTNYIQLAITSAMHARKRGYAAQVLPEDKGSADLRLIRDDQTLYVKAGPLRDGKKRGDWRGLSAMNKGRVAFFTWTLSERVSFTKECRQEHISGMATDLETLVQVKYKSITDQSPLWLETW